MLQLAAFILAILILIAVFFILPFPLSWPVAVVLLLILWALTRVIRH